MKKLPKINTKKVTWEEIENWCKKLSEIILESKWIPDIIIAISRGGYVPARLICDLLVVGELVSIQITHWPSAAQMAKEAGVKHPLQCDLSTKKALIVDDIADTGDSIIIAKDHIWTYCRPKELKVATLQWISKVSKIKPDYYVEEVKEWIWYQYPWTRLEDIIGFIRKIIEEEKEIKSWDIDIISQKIIEYYGVEFDKWYYEKALNYLTEKGFLRKEESKYIR